MDQVIKKISIDKFGFKPNSFEQILDKGKVNKVFKVSIKDEFYNDSDYLNSYQKEFYCIREAENVGIPVSKIYFVGIEGEYSYMILNYIEGVNGLDTPAENHQYVYKTLGEYAKRFNQVNVGGFGRNVKDEHSGFFENWNLFYKQSIETILNDGILVENNILTTEQVEKIRNRILEMKDWDIKPKLCHGNLHISNTIISPENKVFVIDWGNGVGHLAPHVDLADLIAWKDRKYLDDFLEGYGMSKDGFENIEHDVNNILIIQLLSVIKYSLKIGKKFHDENFIDGSVSRIMELK
jgi:fructosamine-3-kinase